ncbi:hypothetical protein JB92DRAFT_3106067 [Gautieria morchelliformis]|nr:hypothetical protein JB92DRAFT_3106067 [Gautieria morchelliformis]
MYAGRTLNGLGVGSATSIIPVFIAEFSPPVVGGGVIGIYEIMYHWSPGGVLDQLRHCIAHSE